MRTMKWMEYLANKDILEPIFLDVHLYDIPETIERSVRILAERRDVAKVSVHPSCEDAALRGQIDGRPEIVTWQLPEEKQT